MPQVLDELTAREIEFIASQKVFFVATAPLAPHHHVNVSPKTPGTSVTVLGPKKVAYADLAGSGTETAAHVSQNGRITLLFVNLEAGPPKILRLHGKAKLVPADDIDKDLLLRFPSKLTQSPGFRSVFVISVERISASCGYSMPVMDFCRYRSTLDDLLNKLGREEIQDYCLKHNSYSIDGLPGVAQQGQNAPRVLPYREEGFVLGRVVGDACVGNETRQTKGYIKSIARIIAEVTATVNGLIHYLELRPWMLSTLGFVVGVIVGSCFLTREIARSSLVNKLV